MSGLKIDAGLTLVDLFAGCGGLSLGFENGGFTPVLVSELNDSARATYLTNRLGSDRFADRHRVSLLDQDAPKSFDLDRDLIEVGDVSRLDDGVLERIVRASQRTVRKGIDVVAGGPPCQGFSGIGHRRTHRVERHEIPSNHLYLEMIRVIAGLSPKAFVFENVRGLLSARWTANGEKHEVWRDIRETFRRKLGDRYRMGWKLVQARDYGVPQNRPRVLLIGIRRDVATLPSTGDDAVELGLLPAPAAGVRAPDPVEVLGDLCDPDWTWASEYLKTESYPEAATSEYQRKMRRSRSGDAIRRKGESVSEHEYSRHARHVVERFDAIRRGDLVALERLKTKKFAQRLLPARWGEEGPTITVTSLPDDFVHFAQPRSLTVREWARLQGFPDWYEFKGPRTTGGDRRAGNPSQGIWTREVPKYTQIGNAVPVQLAEVVANHLCELLT